jgi:CSLREA domain-containing protein
MTIQRGTSMVGGRRMARQGLRFLLGLGLALSLGVAGAAHAATFTVTNAGDAAGTTCGASCSLRQAIGAANLTVAADVIQFNIAGSGPFVIAPTTALPTITQPLTIDGYTQAGAAANTLAVGSNAVIKINLNGSALGITGQPGLAVCAAPSSVLGLSITDFPGAGINAGRDQNDALCAVGTSGVTISGNFLGLAPDGTTIQGNGADGLKISTTFVTVGGAPAARNIISGNNAFGIRVVADQNTIRGNLIGTDRSGLLDRGNGSAGVGVIGASEDIALGDATAPNVIAFNAVGTLVVAASVDNSVLRNHYFANNALGIDLIASGTVADGITPNDPNDTDAGGNNLQNFPENISVSRSATGLSISGRVDREATATSITYTIGVYANPDCSAASDREGERFLGTFNFTSTNQSIETFNNVAFATTDALPIGAGVVLTATDPTGNTSEFSACTNIDAVSPTFTVNKIADTNDGACNADCSLREAITAANANLDGNIIAFSIPGAGPHTIAPTSVLPTISNPVLIDGYTQPGSVPNTSATASNAVIQIRLDGVSAGSTARALAICGSNVWVRGLSVTRFSQSAIHPGRDNADASCSPDPRHTRITGNFVGLGPDGVAALGSNGNGIRIDSAPNSVIGGAALAERNVVSDNASGIVLNGAVDSVVLGNLVGTSASGTLDRGNANGGLLILGSCARSVSGDERAPNLIRFNGSGIDHRGGTGDCQYFANDVSANDALGIDHCAGVPCPDGVTSNDPNDGDTGSNNLQNFPVIASASVFSGVLTIAGSLDVPVAASTTFALAAYESAACDSVGGNGEGSIYLGHAFARITGAAENFRIQLPNAPAVGSVLTMTATDDLGNTSEFSTCITVTDGGLVFSNGFE